MKMSKEEIIKAIEEAKDLKELKLIKENNLRAFRKKNGSCSKALAVKALELSKVFLDNTEDSSSTTAEASNPDPTPISKPNNMSDNEAVVRFVLSPNPSKDLTANYNDIMAYKPFEEMRETIKAAFGSFTEEEINIMNTEIHNIKKTA